MPNDLTTTLFIEPLDVLILRGNKLFADAGSHGEALMPPWPSVAAGALRSRILSDAGVNSLTGAPGGSSLDATLRAVLGSLEQPGAFRIGHFGLARRQDSTGTLPPAALLPMPADIHVNADDNAIALRPTALHPALADSSPLALTPTLLLPRAGKPKTGLWLTAAGIAAWQCGEPLTVAQEHWVASKALWTLDSRLGIALENARHAAAEGQLYTSEAVALKPGVGFVVQVEGAGGLLPTQGLLRFGGDGHAASISATTTVLPRIDHDGLAKSGRFRLMLTSPGIFPEGWRLPGSRDDGRWYFHGASARLACAALSRLETLSGWDIARQQPKPAVRAVPTGSVYWLDDFQGDAAALDALATHGLALEDAARRAEGFNHVLLAEWR